MWEGLIKDLYTTASLFALQAEVEGVCANRQRKAPVNSVVTFSCDEKIHVYSIWVQTNVNINLSVWESLIFTMRILKWTCSASDVSVSIRRLIRSLLWPDTSGEQLPATFETRFVYLNGSFSPFAYMQTLKKTAPASFGALIGIFKSFPVSWNAVWGFHPALGKSNSAVSQQRCDLTVTAILL